MIVSLFFAHFCSSGHFRFYVGPDDLRNGGETPKSVSPLNRKLDSVSISASPGRDKDDDSGSAIVKKGDVDDEFMDTAPGSSGTVHV